MYVLMHPGCTRWFRWPRLRCRVSGSLRAGVVTEAEAGMANLHTEGFPVLR